MTQLDDATLRATADKLIRAHEEASRSNEWTFFVDELYARDCVYTCEYAGVREDGSCFETPGVSFITLNSEAKIVRQFDMFDLAHQMRLCDELEDAGLLSGELKENWVLPMKARLEAQLACNC